MKTTTSKIGWTDYTFNVWRGCTKVSAGCARCYAETLSKRNPRHLGEWGKGKPRVLASDAMWQSPMAWDKTVICGSCGKPEVRDSDDCRHCGTELRNPRRPRVFCASLADWLDDEVPIAWLARLLALIHATPNLDWQLLTKRPQNWRERLFLVLAHARTPFNHPIMSATPDQAEMSFILWLERWLTGTPPPNVWIGTSVEDQAAADERLPHLLSIPAQVRFLSCEPLLGPVDLAGDSLWGSPCHRCQDDRPEPDTNAMPECRDCDNTGRTSDPAIDWVIAGGESGHGCRPMDPAWAMDLAGQCARAGVPFFMKQMGGHPDKRAALDQLHPFLRHRQFPGDPPTETYRGLPILGTANCTV